MPFQELQNLFEMQNFGLNYVMGYWFSSKRKYQWDLFFCFYNCGLNWYQFYSTPNIEHILLIHIHCCCSVTKSCSTLCSPIECSTPDFPVLHYFLEFAQTHVSWLDDAIQPSHPLPLLCSFSFSLFQHQNLFQWVSLLPQMPKVLELQLQHQSFQWIFRLNFL